MVENNLEPPPVTCAPWGGQALICEQTSLGWGTRVCEQTLVALVHQPVKYNHTMASELLVPCLVLQCVLECLPHHHHIIQQNILNIKNHADNHITIVPNLDEDTLAFLTQVILGLRELVQKPAKDHIGTLHHEKPW